MWCVALCSDGDARVLAGRKYPPNHGQGYYFRHNAETYYLIGKAMATGMLSLLPK